jgi:predicted enzyme related to lactoylglutathione lyase
MKIPLLILGLALLCFYSGYAFKGYLTRQSSHAMPDKGRATGIGGVFFKCKNPAALRQWYHTHLGLEVNDYGSVFEWYQGADSTKKGFTQWSPFKETTTYFGASEQQWMVNYRVHNIEALLEQLKAANVKIVDSLETYDYGKFIHIEDLEGHRIELWEPNDVVYEKMGVDMGAKTTK